MEQKTIFNRSLKLMGNLFQLSAVTENEDWANECIDTGIAEIQRIEKLLTSFR